MSETSTNPQENWINPSSENQEETNLSQVQSDTDNSVQYDTDVSDNDEIIVESASDIEPSVQAHAVIDEESAEESAISSEAELSPSSEVEAGTAETPELALAEQDEAPVSDNDAITAVSDEMPLALAEEVLIVSNESDSGSAPVSESDTTYSTESEEKAETTQAVSEIEIVHVEEAEIEAMESEEAEKQPEDYTGLDKELLVTLAEQLNRDHDPILASRVIQKIRPLFDAMFQQEKQAAMDKFIEEGGTAETFEFKHQSLEQRFNQAQKGISDKRRVSQEFQNKERAKNLEIKLGLLDQLRTLVDDHEHTPGYEKFKSIREEWKKVGPVGQEHAQNLNASYFSLLDRFHSLSEIYHNLRDFDRKKNLDLKLDIVARIEKLADEQMISKAMKELNSLQEEYRSIGPVPNDNFEELKSRLKAAADVIYDRRRVFNEERKGLLQEELSLKDALVEKIAAFEHFSAKTAKEWQEKTKELVALQEEWKAVPGRFRDKTAEQGKQFWTVFKKYMANKNEFFKELDKGRKEVLAAKIALVEEVKSLKDGDDWDGITNRMKQIQAEWRNIAPVFSKEGQKVYDEFKAGIDHFFNRLRERRSGEDKVQMENLAAKEALCNEIEALAASGKGDKAAVDAFREQFRNVGHVPMKQMQRINGRFSKAVMTLIDASSEISAHEKERMKINVLSSRSTYSSEGVKQLKNQEGYIQKRLQQLRKDAGNLEDNVAMFRMSKNAMAMIEDVQKRINLYHMEIRELEAQLREIRNTEKAES
jgi:hypothetical protein